LGAPAGATIKVDDVAIGGTVFTDEIADKTKEVEIAISASGFRPFVSKVILTRGKSSTISVSLEPKVELRKPDSVTNLKLNPRLTDYPALYEYLSVLRDIPMGTFDLGSSTGPAQEKPITSTSISAFRMGSYPVTVAVWKEYCTANNLPMPRRPSWGFVDDHPIVNVSWFDIVGVNSQGGFCDWVSNLGGYRLTLPTEAQHEYVARFGTSGQEYPWKGEFDDSKVWSSVKLCRQQTASVIRKSNVYQNSLGIIDLVGNVGQWCSDVYYPNYSVNRADVQDRTDPKVNRCIRGGAWIFPLPSFYRCSDRYGCYPGAKLPLIGFRLVSESQ